MGARVTPAWLLALSAFCCAGMWLYVSRVLVRQQEHAAAVYNIPRGNLSDLYPVWLGSRELLLHKKDPYGQEVTQQIQAGYYGRPLDASRAHDPGNQQAFAYPVYVGLLLAPTVNLPFSQVERVFEWLLISCTAISVTFWLGTLGWKPRRHGTTTAILLTLGTFAAVQGIRLQQLSLLVAALIAGSLMLLVSGRLALAGTLLALAMIKPQLALPLAAWLLLWASGAFRSRWRFVVSFLVCLAVLVLGGEFLLPGWIGKFHHAVLAYLSYAAGGSLLEQMLGHAFGTLLGWALVAATAAACWRGRRSATPGEQFLVLTCLVLAITVVIIPMFPPHYQLLLVPGILLLLRDWGKLSRGARILFALGMIALAWQWFSAAILVLISFFGDAERFWALPLWTTILLPVPIAASLALHTWRQGEADPTTDR